MQIFAAPSHWEKTAPSIIHILPSILLRRSAKVDAPGWVNFVSAFVYHLCLSLPAAFTQPGTSTLADICAAQRKLGAGIKDLPRSAGFQNIIRISCLFTFGPDFSISSRNLCSKMP